MKTPEEIKKAAACCFDAEDCKGCPYINHRQHDITTCPDLIEDLIVRNEQLEATISGMLMQMHGDCGVCKHRHEQAAVFRKAAMKGEFAINERCAGCIKKETRPNWEYEGALELPKKGATT